MDQKQAIIEELAEHLQPVFKNSPDGVYLYLDDAHKVCNEKLAKLFGYTVSEWCAKQPFQASFVAEQDQQSYCSTFTRHVSTPAFPVTFRFRGKRKDGSTFAAETDMIPLYWHGYPIGYNFVRQLKEAQA